MCINAGKLARLATKRENKCLPNLLQPETIPLFTLVKLNNNALVWKGLWQLDVKCIGRRVDTFKCATCGGIHLPTLTLPSKHQTAIIINICINAIVDRNHPTISLFNVIFFLGAHVCCWDNRPSWKLWQLFAKFALRKISHQQLAFSMVVALKMRISHFQCHKLGLQIKLSIGCLTRNSINCASISLKLNSFWESTTHVLDFCGTWVSYYEFKA